MSLPVVRALVCLSCVDMAACSARTGFGPDQTCATQVLEPGQLRVCQLAADERPNGVGARTTDWRLQNALLDVIVRGDYAPLTRLEGAGGTVVAAMPVGGADPIMELVPTLPGGWFDELSITQQASEDQVSLLLEGHDADGVARQLTYRLAADEPTLVLDGAVGFELLPQAGDVLVGGTLEHDAADPADPSTDDGETVVLAAAGSVVDLGGLVQWTTADRVSIGDRRTVVQARWPDAVAVSGVATGASWVEVSAGVDLLSRLPVALDGFFSGSVPAQADGLAASSPGHAVGPAAAPGQDVELDLGVAGMLRVRAVDEWGQDLAAVLQRGADSWAVPAGGTTLPVGPGVADTWLWAGPRHEAAWAEQLAVEDEVTLSAVLPTVGPANGSVLAELDQAVWPALDTRQLAAEVLALASGRGVGFVVAVVNDEIAQDLAVDAHVAQAIELVAGSRTATDTVGQPVSWPWSADFDRAAQGALPWQGLSSGDLLSALRAGGQRVVIVDGAWLDAATADGGLDDLNSALALRLDDLSDLPAWLDLVDDHADLPVVGPWTWVEGVDPAAYSAVDVQASLVEGRTIASTGPQITLRVEGQGPGSLVSTQSGDASVLTVSLRVDTPGWSPVERLRLFGRGGVVLAEPAVQPGPVAVDVVLSVDASATDWLVAVVDGNQASPLTGQPAWAVTSPVWIE